MDIFLDYRVRYAFTILFALGCVGWLYLCDAPQWAYAFAAFATTLTSRLDSIADAQAMRSTVRTQTDPIAEDVEKLRDGLRAMYEELR